MCERDDLQFLDGTTTLHTIRIRRNSEGRLTLVRRFHFDFFNGHERLTGKITVSDNKITDIYIEKLPAEPSNIKPTNLFNPANEVSNVIPFPGKKLAKSEDDTH